MRRLVLQAYCGIEWVEDRREVEAVFSETITVGKTTRNIDLCEDHVVVQDLHGLEALLQKYGTRVDFADVQTSPPKRTSKTGDQSPDVLDLLADGRRRCTIPGCDHGPGGGPFITKLGATNPNASLGQHKRNKHNVPGQSITAQRERALKQTLP